ncbi:MAG TPA: metalloregulator ArsR/SmtB family transcription factor [Flavisolibacter sp.]|nr:metalloregulator ArsR/SmtB family transcription factor [Flavisolibacter sp.]
MPATSNPVQFEIASHDLKKAALIFRAVNHPLRQRILQMIHRQERMTVTAIFTRLRMKQSITSQHLAVLRKAGLVCTEKKGKNIYYDVSYERLDQLHELAGKLIH